MSLIRKHGAVLQAWACLALITTSGRLKFLPMLCMCVRTCHYGNCLLAVDVRDDDGLRICSTASTAGRLWRLCH